MYTYDAAYETNLAVPVGGSVVNGKAIAFSNAADKPGCLGCLIKYTPGDNPRTLGIGVEYSSSNGTLTTDWYSPQTSASTSLTGAGSGVDSFTFISLGLPGNVSKIRLTFASAGAGAADDTVSVVLTGLPTTGVTVT